MVVTCSHVDMLDDLLKSISEHHPTIDFKQGETFYWSPSEHIVYYNPEDNTPEGLWALLHESGHALLSHRHYYSDIELVRMELEAWERAKLLGENMSISIDDDHVQDCLDSYRDWLYKRSLCPDCNLAGLQTDARHYMCIFCHKQWSVSSERFCRPYRRAL